MKSNAQLVRDAVRASNEVFTGADAARLIAHFKANNTEVVISEYVEGVPSWWTVFGRDHGPDKPPEAWVPWFPRLRGLERDPLGYSKYTDLINTMYGCLQRPIAMLSVEDGFLVRGVVRSVDVSAQAQAAAAQSTPSGLDARYGSEPVLFATDVYGIRHARFYDYEEQLHMIGRKLRCNSEPILFNGPCTDDWIKYAWGRASFFEKGVIHKLRIKAAKEQRWQGKRAVAILERSTP